MALQEEETQQLLSPATVIDALFCEEESLEDENGIGEEGSDENVKKHSFFPSVLLENDLVWEDDELVSLKSKEGETHVCLSRGHNPRGGSRGHGENSLFFEEAEVNGVEEAEAVSMNFFFLFFF